MGMDISKIGDTFSWTHKNTFLKEKKGLGIGVFAKNSMKMGATITIFGGYILSLNEEASLDKSIRDNGLQIEENFVLAIKNKNEIEKASFFNHSCNPNAGFTGQISLIALRDIKKGEEITFDYAMVLYNGEDKINYSFKCLCNSKKCRRIITDHDWKKKSIQNKYKGFFQPFLEEKIKEWKKISTIK